MTDQLVEQVVRKAYLASRKSGDKDRATAVLRDPGAPATALLLAATRLFGPEIREFEPETLWLRLDPPLPNRDKLSAAIALGTLPSFYWEARAFGATALALNDDPVLPAEFPRTTPDQLAWAVLEAEILHALQDDGASSPAFGDEVAAYTAAMIFDAGLVLCPDRLEFADDELRRLLTSEGRELRTQAMLAMKAPARSGAPVGDASPVDLQLARLDRTREHVRVRLEACLRCLESLA
jgi:hypothetical protein